MKIIQMKVSSDPDLDTVWKVLTTTGSSPSNFGLTVAYVSVIFSISQNHCCLREYHIFYFTKSLLPTSVSYFLFHKIIPTMNRQ